MQIWVGAPIITEITGRQHYPNGGSGRFWANVSGDGNLSYNWSVYPSRPISFNGNSAVIEFPSTNGDFQITLTVTNECGSAMLHYYASTGEYEPYKLYPNPAKDIVNIQLAEETLDNQTTSTQRVNKTAPSGVIEIQLWSATALVRTYKAEQSTYQIPVSDLAKGTYFVRVIKDGQIHTQKLIKN